MEVRDPVHGAIPILAEEENILQHPLFSRLRNIKQLGFSEYIFPGATHTRYLHSIGVMNVGEKVFDKIFKNYNNDTELKKLKHTFKLACLLHDIGHAPLSHSTEVMMPNRKALNLPARYCLKNDGETRATHEDYTIKAICDSPLVETFSALQKNYGVDPFAIADLVLGTTTNTDYFTYEGNNFFPLLTQLVSSELDCDRMDYLLRDSYFCGVSYGQYDLGWLTDNLEICLIDDHAYLGVNERALVTFDDFLLSRYHMFIMVYFHYRSVCLEQLLYRFFKTSKGEYQIPSKLDEYIQHDDRFLINILKATNNKYAKQIIENKIPLKIYESFNPEQEKKLLEIKDYLENNKIEYIHCNSSSRLSKYYDIQSEEKSLDRKKINYPIMSIRKSFNNRIEYKEIHEATDLYSKFTSSHSIGRLHCDYQALSEKHKNALNHYIK